MRVGDKLRGRTAALAMLTAALGGTTAAPAAAGPNDSYVALGDSYAAGPVIPLYEKPYGCLKSTNNYGHLAAPKIGLPVYRDATCSGAETEDMTQPQGVSPGPNPPQFDSLDADTKVVSITIGGNDIGFSSIAQNCLDTTPANQQQPCKGKYVNGSNDEVSNRIAATGPKVGEVLQGIHARSPQARILVVNYPAIFPHTGKTGCWPQMPVADGDVPWLREKQEELNAMLATQAAANGATLVDAYRASVGHDSCQLPLFRWVEPVIPASPAAPVHPNLFGMKAMARLVDAAVP